MILAWSWLCLPYLLCVVSLIALVLVAALVRGDRVMRLGVLGAAVTTLPWVMCSALVACTSDAELATRLLRLGSGPVALIGPNLLLVLLGVTGQLERHRWIARMAAVVGAVMMGLCWSTAWTVPGVHRLSSGMFYVNAGPLTPFHLSQLGIWLAVGMYIARQSSAANLRRRTTRLLLVVLGIGAIGASDLLLVYDVWGAYPFAWFPTLVGSGVALYLVLRTDLLRSRGLDRDALLELAAFAIVTLISAYLVFVMAGSTTFALAAAASGVWVFATGVTWSIAQRQQIQVPDTGALEHLVSQLADQVDAGVIAGSLAQTWKIAIDVEVIATWRADGERLVKIGGAGEEIRAIDREVIEWLVGHGESLATGDLATMRVGPIRPLLEGLFAAHAATLIVPLLDRGSLVGLVEAAHARTLHEGERGLVIESARAAARALTFIGLSSQAAREGEVAREVEVAEAMRLQASASRDDELGRWMVAAEYRTAPRTTGAGWSAALLPDGRLAVLITEAQAHGVPAALATAALTGAFAAATTGTGTLELDGLLSSLHASAEGVVRGGEPVAAFIALLDHQANTIAWASAGHPGAVVMVPEGAGPLGGESVTPLASAPVFATGSLGGTRPNFVALGGGGQRIGASLAVATRGQTALPADAVLVIASTELRGEDELRWQMRLYEVATAGSRIPAMLVETALRQGAPAEDLLAVVVRKRADRRGETAPIG